MADTIKLMASNRKIATDMREQALSLLKMTAEGDTAHEKWGWERLQRCTAVAAKMLATADAIDAITEELSILRP